MSSGPNRHCGLQAAEDGDETAAHRSFISVNLQTGLCDWSAKYFAQPVMKVSAAWFRGEIEFIYF